MNNCTDLYLLSTIACELSNCLSEDELAVLASSLVVLGEMLESVLVRKERCGDRE